MKISLIILISIISIFVSLVICTDSASASTATGTYESAVFDAGVDVDWSEVSWTASISASSTIEMRVRTGTTSDMSSAAAWNSCVATSNGADVSPHSCVNDGDTHFQFQALFSTEYSTTSDNFVSAELYDVRINYEAAGILTSSIYDTLAGDTELTDIRWSENRPAGTDVLFQIRSSADASTWTDWLGPSTSTTHFTDPSGGESLHDSLADGSDERYFQYRVILYSGGLGLPDVSDVTVDYSATVPNVTSVSPEFIGSNASGTVSVVLSGQHFTGSSVAVESGGMSIDINNLSVSADTISFDVDSSLLYGGPVNITITDTNGVAITYSELYVNEYRGSYVSSSVQLTNLEFGALSWSGADSATSSLIVKARTDNASDMSGAPAWDTCPELINGQDISDTACVTDQDSYFQYRAEITGIYGTSTAYIPCELQDVSLDYIRYAASGTIVSSPFDTGSASNTLRKVMWSENAPAGTDIRLQVRTAPDAGGSPGNWSAWTGVYDKGGYYYDHLGSTGIYIGHADESGDQWLQYRAFLTSNGYDTPVLSDVTLEYGDKISSEVIFRDNTIIKEKMIFR